MRISVWSSDVCSSDLAHEANVRQNAEVMVLLRDVPLEESIDELAFDPTSIDVEEVCRHFEFLEFNTLSDRLGAALDTDLGPSASEAAGPEAEVCQVRSGGRRGGKELCRTGR